LIQTFHVFAIRLDDGVLEKPTFRAKNPRHESGKGCYYVGSSAHEPERALRELKEDDRSSAVVRDHALYVSKTRCFAIQVTSRFQCEAAENEFAEKLRAGGYGVWQG
jgi:hypothetical protein